MASSVPHRANHTDLTVCHAMAAAVSSTCPSFAWSHPPTQAPQDQFLCNFPYDSLDPYQELSRSIYEEGLQLVSYSTTFNLCHLELRSFRFPRWNPTLWTISIILWVWLKIALKLGTQKWDVWKTKSEQDPNLSKSLQNCGFLRFPAVSCGFPKMFYPRHHRHACSLASFFDAQVSMVRPWKHRFIDSLQFPYQIYQELR